MKLLSPMAEFEARLPRLQAEIDEEIVQMMDWVDGNAPLQDLRDFRKAGVRLAHA